MNRLSKLAVCVALVLIGACASWPASADTVTATWINPTENTDGTPIPVSGEGALTSARVAWGTCSAEGVFGTEAGAIVRSMPVSSVVFNLKPGNWCVRVTVTNTYGETSEPSNVATHFTPPPKPKPATGVTVTRGMFQP